MLGKLATVITIGAALTASSGGVYPRHETKIVPSQGCRGTVPVPNILSMEVPQANKVLADAGFRNYSFAFPGRPQGPEGWYVTGSQPATGTPMNLCDPLVVAVLYLG